MASVAVRTETIRPWVTEKIFMGLPLGDYLRGLLTPFNAIAAAIMAIGVPVIVYRFVHGLGAVSNLSQSSPWGLWIGLDMMSGVALAAGGYTIAGAVYVLGLERYRPIVRPAVLTAFLGYVFAVLGLLVDLGRPWRIALSHLLLGRPDLGDVRGGEVNAGAVAEGRPVTDPYGAGWLVRVRPTRLGANLKGLLTGEFARRWMATAADQLRRRVSPELGLVYEDGGALVDGLARSLDPEGWDRLARECFLTERPQ